MLEFKGASLDLGYTLSLIDGEGHVIGYNGRSLDWLLLEDRIALADSIARSSTCAYTFVQHSEFGPSILAVATPEIAGGWQGVTPQMQNAAVRRGCYIACGTKGLTESDRFATFADAFGWTPAVSRTVYALYQYCDVRIAAERTGISFHTAREHLKAAREAIGASNLPLLVMLLNVASTGIIAAGGESSELLFELFDLTERQLRIADHVANGATRIETAAEFGVSEALVKKEMAAIFDATGVTSSIGLARIMSEAKAIAMYTRYRANISPFPPPHCQRIAIAERGRTIVANDYGPRRGRPVLVLHSSMTSRATNRQLVEALQNAGFRPLALDRPGFGDTDAAAEVEQSQPDPFRSAAEDMVAFCAHMQFGVIDIVTRGAAQAMLALHDLAPTLIGRAVIVNPDPDPASSTKRAGRMGAIKHSFAKRPWAVAAMARFIAVLSTYDRSRESMLKAVADCEPDRIVMSDQANVTEYYRGIEPYHRGRIRGFIDEQVAMATGGKPAPRLGTGNFHILLGTEDFLHDPAEVAAYWRDVLPDGQIELVEGAGRFLTYSHAHRVAKALTR